MFRRLFALLALLTFSTVVAGCPTRGGNDDDDDANDDDSAVADDDDATSADDDDDSVDDDDSGGDDDDATGDDDDSTFVEGNSSLTGIWYIAYWQDAAQTIPVCQQAYRFEGLAEARLNVLGNSCPSCTAKIDIVNITDVTGGIPSGDPMEASYNTTVTTPCVANNFASGQANYGDILSSTTMVPGGDYVLTQGLIDSGTGQAEALDLTQDGATNFVGLAATYAGSGVSLTHVGYVNSAGGGQLTELGLDAIAVEAPPTTGYWPYWTYFTQGGATDGRLIGQYGIGSLWLLNSNGEGVDYEIVTFTGSLIGQ